MAKKKNIVKKGIGNMQTVLVLLLIVGWLMAVMTFMAADDDVKAQKALIDQAEVFLEDKLYVRAVSQYTTALTEYQTENNLTYETQLLGIYKEAGMLEEYYSLIDKRRDAGTAAAEEYLDEAQAQVDRGSIPNAMGVLQQGMERYPQETEMRDLYESIRYRTAMTDMVYKEARMPGEDWYIPVFNGEKWGYVGGDGRMALEFLYEEALPFSGEYAVVRLDGVYTLIDKNGYRNAVDKNGLEQVTAIAGTRIAGIKDGKFGIYTNSFRQLGDETYDDVCLNDNGMILVQKGGKWALLDSNLGAVTDYVFTDVARNSRGQAFSGDYAVVADEQGYFLVDQTGAACYETRFADAKGLEDGLYAVADASGKWGFVNGKGEYVIDCRYEDALSFSDSLAAVKEGGKWGYVNRYQTMIVEPQFAEAYPFLNGKALTVDDLGCYDIVSLKYYSYF